VWDIATGKIVANVGEPEPSGVWPHNTAMGFCVSPNGRYLAVASDGTNFYRNLAIYDTRSWKRLRWWKVPEDPFSISCSLDGKFIFTGSFFGSVSIVRADGKEPPRTYRARDKFAGYGLATIDSVAGSPNGLYTVIGAVGVGPPDRPPRSPAEATRERDWGNSLPIASVLRLADGRRVADFIEPNSVINPNAIAWDPQGRYIAFVDINRRLVLWRPFEPRPSYLKISVPDAFWFAVSPDGDRIAVPSGSGMIIFTVSGIKEETGDK
jgi:WD40 repeat protein